MIFCYFLFLGCFLAAPIIQQNSFKGINFITLPFNISNNQIKITLDSQYIDEYQLQPFLFICLIKPTSTTFMQLLSDEKCFVNWFSYQMRQTQYLILQKQSTSKEISNYYQIYQYDESLYIGFQSTNEANIIVRIQQISSDQCILVCQNETECKNQICNCNFYQVGQDCNLIIDDLTSQQIFQGKKIYYVDVQKGQNESQSVLLEFQNSTTFYGFCITQNFNPNLITQQNNKTLYISLDQINQCYEEVLNLREQFNSSINYYFLIYFDTNNHTYLESSIQNTDNSQLIIILSTILSSMSFCFVFCLIKSNCFKKQKEPEKENQKYELKHAPSLIDQFFPSQEFVALRNKCEKLVTLNQCLICLDLFYDDSRVRVTYCNHIFHTSCFDKWMNVHKSCPNCRSLFDEESILKYSNQKEAEIFQWSSRTEEVKTTLKPLINETQQQQPQVSQLDSQKNIQAF